MFHMPMALEACATLAVACQEYKRAACLWGNAAALRQQTGLLLWPVELPDYEKLVAITCQALGEQHFIAAWQAGQALSWEAAFDETLAWLRACRKSTFTTTTPGHHAHYTFYQETKQQHDTSSNGQQH